MIIDISQQLNNAIMGFPGDTIYVENFVAQIGGDAPVNVSPINFSAHCDTHADAPFHYDPSGKTIGQMSLEPFIGPARVSCCALKSAPTEINGTQFSAPQVQISLNCCMRMVLN